MNTASQLGAIISDFLGPIIHSPVVDTSLRLATWGLVILWFVTVLWAFRDAMARTHNLVVVLGAPAVVLAATPLGFPLAVLIWRILRPQHTMAEAREQRLTIEALRAASRPHTCPSCRATVNEKWRRCPWCRTWLMAPCPRCERLVEPSAAVCPWCVLELAPRSLAPREGAPAMVPVMATSAVMVPAMDPGAFEQIPVEPASGAWAHRAPETPRMREEPARASSALW